METKALPACCLAQVSGTAAGLGNENIGPVIEPMTALLAQRLELTGIEFGPTAIATYEELDDAGSGVRVNAACEVSPGTQGGQGFDVVDLPAVELAATTVHLGSMDTIDKTWESLVAWITANGYQLAGVCREHYLVSEPKPQDEWFTELQQPVVRA